MKVTRDNIFKIETGIIIHGCNAQGVMGAGFAEQVKRLYPEAYRAYRDKFEREGLSLGEVISVEVSPGKWICNAITQLNYGSNPGIQYVSYDAVTECFQRCRALSISHNLSIHYPQVGCGYANGKWEIVSGLIDSALEGRDHTLHVL